ncbi:hypothetical protein PG985_011276 [Apiospora marii]|uniref:uncharacterized protein n=1 Tax=Apiospora marii TaxID=335849 RepID=UPI00312D5FFD
MATEKNDVETSSTTQGLGRRWRLFPEAPTKDPGPPPDGGTLAWLQVLAGHLMCFITWGLITSFGIFQSTYEDMLHAASSTISWIGTVQIFMLLLVGTLSGRASDAGLVHQAVLLGTLLIVIGMFLSSLAMQYYQLFLSQGVCVGLGMGILYMPGLSVPSSYFKAKKSVAVAIVATGAGTGGVVYPAMARQLLHTVGELFPTLQLQPDSGTDMPPITGLAWTIRSMAFVTLFVAVLVNLLLRVRVPARRSGLLADLGAFKEPSYLFFVIGFFLIYWAVYFVFYYIDLYGYQYGHFTSQDSINLLLLTNALGIPGRVVPGFVATYLLGPLNTAVPTALCVAVVLYCWPAAAHAHGPLYAFAAVYGFVASAVQSLFAVSLAALTDDPGQLGTRMGMVFTVVAFACLTGSPLAGAIMEADDGGYLGAQMWAATSMLLGSGALIVARVYKTGWVFKRRV